MFSAVLRHDFRQLVVHVVFNVGRNLFHLWRFFADEFATHRPLGWERLSDCLCLEAHNRFCNHGVEHTTCAVPRFCAFFYLQAQKFETVNVRLLPILAAILVVVNVRHQVPSQRLQGAAFYVLGQVIVKAFFAVVFSGREGDLHPVHTNGDFFGINDLDLQGGLLLTQRVNAHWLLVQRFVDVRCHVCS